MVDFGGDWQISVPGYQAEHESAIQLESLFNIMFESVID
jgi:hypothetical protein